MSNKSLKFKTSEISEMISVCNVRNDCNRSCIGCDYNHRGHKICRDMLEQFNQLSRSEQISIVIKSRIEKV